MATTRNESQSKIQLLIEQARHAWVARDADALAALFTVDGEFIVPGQRWHGQEQIRDELSTFVQQHTDVDIKIQRLVIDGNQAALEWQYADTEIATGKRSQVDDAIVLEVKDGKIHYWREYFDMQTTPDG